MKYTPLAPMGVFVYPHAQYINLVDCDQSYKILTTDENVMQNCTDTRKMVASKA